MCITLTNNCVNQARLKQNQNYSYNKFNVGKPIFNPNPKINRIKHQHSTEIMKTLHLDSSRLRCNCKACQVDLIPWFTKSPKYQYISTDTGNRSFDVYQSQQPREQNIPKISVFYHSLSRTILANIIKISVETNIMADIFKI